MRFEEVPPGEIETIKMPSFQIGSIGAKLIIKTASRGRNTNCKLKPVYKALDLANVLIKSLILNEDPIPNIMNPNVIEITISITATNQYLVLMILD